MHHPLASLRVQQGRLEEARGALAEALLIFARLGDEWGIVGSLEALAVVAGAHGEPRQAARLLGLAEHLRGSIGATAWQTRPGEADGLAAAGRTDLREPDFSLEQQASTSAAARLALGDQIFAMAQAEGRTLPVNVILAEAQPAPSRPATADPPRLTEREREVARLIGRGLTSAEIADRLVITPRTADTHADNIRSKLGLRSRTEIASWATAHGLTSSDPQGG